jgi:hypothetical protein
MQSDNFFKNLDFVLKKKGVLETEESNLPSQFITNRWISMVDGTCANILNLTTNRWLTKKGLCSLKYDNLRLLKKIIPQNTRNIKYIQKQKNVAPKNENFNNIDDVLHTDDNMRIHLEISNREILEYKKLLADFNCINK